MEITGKVIRILPEKKGTSSKGEWQKQDFILETQAQYPKKVCISVWNNKFDLQSMSGKIVKASIDIESREYNERWYTDVRAWKLELMESENSSTQPPVETYKDDVEGLSWSNDQEDDLPF